MKRFTYFAHSPQTNLIKIGQSGAPNKRMRSIKPRAELLIVAEGHDLSEKSAHQLFAESRVTGEWFEIDRDSVLSALEARGIPFNIVPKSLKKRSRKRLSNPYPVHLDKTEAVKVADLALKTGISKAEIIRRCLRLALPEFVSGSADLLQYGRPASQSQPEEAA